MTPAEYEEGLKKAAAIQREAGWAESSIMQYATDHRACTEAMGGPSAILLVGAGLAQDNSRYGVVQATGKTFEEELAELYNKHKQFVGSCGCCGGTSIKDNSPEIRRYGGIPEIFTANNVEGT